MSGDLLRYLGGPGPYSGWWLVLGVLVVLLVIAWCAGVFVWTLPSSTLRRIPLIRSIHARVVRRRFARSIRDVVDEYKAGEMSSTDAAAAIRRTLRGFLALETSGRAYFMHVGDMAASDLAAAAPLFSVLDEAQFDTTSVVDLAGVGRDAEELIQTWS